MDERLASDPADGLASGPRAVRIDALKILEQSPMPALLHDPSNGHVIWANEAAAVVHGYALDQMPGLPLAALMAVSGEYSAEQAMERITQTVRMGHDATPWRVRDQQGRQHLIEAASQVVVDEKGRQFVLVQFRDVSVEQEALRREEWLRRLLADSFGGTMIVDLAGIVRYVAPSIRHMLGYTEAEIVGSSIRRLQHPEDQRRIRALVRGLAPHDTSLKYIEYRIRHIDGAYRHHEASLRNLHEDPDVRGVLVSFRDVTDRVEAERDARRRRDEMEFLARYHTMAELGSAIAHELNQPVSAIRNYAVGCLTALKQTRQNEAGRWAVTQIREEAERASRIMRSIRNFTTHEQPDYRMTGLSEILEDIDAFVTLKADESHSRVVIDIEPKYLSAWCDKTLIGQVILNLTINGFQAMQTRPPGERVLHIKGHALNRSHVTISVQDCGQGMAQSQVEHLFEGRSTTKNTGFGLGLVLSRSIIVKHGGKIWTESAPDVGTTMHFTLRRTRPRGLSQLG